MGFIYSKPMTIEAVFGKFDTDNDGRISKQEAKNAKNTDIFTSFKLKKGMTLKTFESENKDLYARYEQLATEAYNKQEEKVKQWLKHEQAAMLDFQEVELAKLEELEKQLEKEKIELEEKISIMNDAQHSGIKISPAKLKILSAAMLRELISIAASSNDEYTNFIRESLERP